MIDLDPRGPQVRSHRGDAQSASSDRPALSASRISQTLALVGILGASVWLSRDAGPSSPVEQSTSELMASLDPSATLPLQVNERVEKWVDRFRTDQRPNFERLLRRQGLYGDMIRAKLRERGMPEELLYLAMMESGFSPRAVSKASAVGVWQFMGPTALQYGLRVDEWVDERRDPIRATDAALDYLEHLQGRFGSWYLAAAAYNAGPGRVERVLRRYADGRTGEEELYWEVWEHLPFETREYVPRILAATLLAENATEYGFDVEEDPARRYERVFVPGRTSLRTLARTSETDLALLRELNPQLVRGVTPPDELYPLLVPVGSSPMVVASMVRAGRGSALADD